MYASLNTTSYYQSPAGVSKNRLGYLGSEIVMHYGGIAFSGSQENYASVAKQVNLYLQGFEIT